VATCQFEADFDPGADAPLFTHLPGFRAGDFARETRICDDVLHGLRLVDDVARAGRAIPGRRAIGT
jgi:hypothetical protein